MLAVGKLAQARWDDLGPSVIEGGFKIGVASDFWNRYEEDIMLAKGLGTRADGNSTRQVTFVTLLLYSMGKMCSAGDTARALRASTAEPASMQRHLTCGCG